MKMKKTFTYRFDEGRPGSLSYDLSLEENERIESLIENGAPTVYMNRAAMLTLAKLLIRFAEGPYPEQFHVHLTKNFGEGPDALTIMLYPDDVNVSAEFQVAPEEQP
jgi:hypothetical protein